MAQLVDVEFGCVYDDVRELADGFHELAFVAQAFTDGKMLAQRMRTARLAVAAQQSVLARIDENEGDRMLPA